MLTLARQAGDRQLEDYALVSLSWIPLYTPETDHKAVLTALESAAELQRFLHPAGRALEPGWGWWSTYGELGGWDGARPQVFTGTRALSLGHAAEALELFDGALAGTAMPVRHSHLHEQLVQSCAALGDPERACASAHAALDESKAYGPGIPPRQIRKASMSFPKGWSTLRPVRELDERLALAR